MKKLFAIFIIVAIISVPAFSQTKIDVNDAAKHVGENVTICTTVYGVKYLESAANAPTLIDLGAAYPNAPVTIVVMGPNRKNFDYKLEKDLLNKEICVTGKIELYKGKPQITVSKQDEIRIQSAGGSGPSTKQDEDFFNPLWRYFDWD